MSKSTYLTDWFRSGEPWIWMNAGAIGISITAVVGIVFLIAVKGFAHFWPSQVQQIDYVDSQGVQRSVYGEFIELDRISRQQFLESNGPSQWVDGQVLDVERWLVKTGNRKASPPDFRWLYKNQITRSDTPAQVIALERVEWGNAYGVPMAIKAVDGSVLTQNLRQHIHVRLTQVRQLADKIDELEHGTLNQINHKLERLRLASRRLAMMPESDANTGLIEAQRSALLNSYAVQEQQLRSLYRAMEVGDLQLLTASGELLTVRFSDIVTAWYPNDQNVLEKLQHYLSALWTFLSGEPREANTEGGIFPAIFGTVLMVMLMSILVTPFGVIAAVYLREYANQGVFVRLIRIAVNNLAGVPSIVYGVFGLGFFVYFLGGNLDRLFYPEALPSPTFGTPGLMWASLTLALLTVPVVIVSTEEGLTRIPRTLREGSLALGATKAETLFRIVLPMASPGILTGVILAVARAAGEVAPLMLVGVVKLAPTLPLDGNFPFLHLDRKFMHLGFHIYDVGFQSPNVEAARPLVYATALLLVLIIVCLNLSAITLRSRLEKRFRGVES